jgi:hypothetical protein
MKKLIAAALFLPSVAMANFETGNSLYADLTSHELVHRMVGLGYVKGIFDAHLGSSICISDSGNINAGQVSDIVLRYLQNNPEYRNYSANFLIVSVLSQVWPCGKKM